MAISTAPSPDKAQQGATGSHYLTTSSTTLPRIHSITPATASWLFLKYADTLLSQGIPSIRQRSSSRCLLHCLTLRQLYICTWLSSPVGPSLPNLLSKTAPSHTDITAGPSFVTLALITVQHTIYLIPLILFLFTDCVISLEHKFHEVILFPDTSLTQYLEQCLVYRRC